VDDHCPVLDVFTNEVAVRTSVAVDRTEPNRQASTVR